eukprot:c37484_g1_i1 orf=1-165(-)
MVEQEQDKWGGVNSSIHGTEREVWNQTKWEARLVDKSDTDPKIMTWRNCRVEGRI